MARSPWAGVFVQLLVIAAAFGCLERLGQLLACSASAVPGHFLTTSSYFSMAWQARSALPDRAMPIRGGASLVCLFGGFPRRPARTTRATSRTSGTATSRLLGRSPSRVVILVSSASSPHCSRVRAGVFLRHRTSPQPSSPYRSWSKLRSSCAPARCPFHPRTIASTAAAIATAQVAYLFGSCMT